YLQNYEKEQDYSAINQKFSNLTDFCQTALEQQLSYPAKRSRPAFFYFASQLVEHEINEDALLQISVGFEFIHTALLFHDDIMDQDRMRRGNPTIHTVFSEEHTIQKLQGDPHHYGISQAISLGDI